MSTKKNMMSTINKAITDQIKMVAKKVHKSEMARCKVRVANARKPKPKPKPAKFVPKLKSTAKLDARLKRIGKH